jgi:ABC-type branched-subunit amino acid transport system permease subunit
MDYLIHIGIVIAIYSLFAMSLNLEVGFTGLYNFGHVAFFGIGAYTSAILNIMGLPFWLSLLSALLAAGMFGFMIGIPSLQLRGDYFGIVTLGFGEIIRMGFQNEVWLTKGPMGLPGIPKPVFWTLRINTLTGYLILVWIFLFLTSVFLGRLVNSPFGRVLRAIREDDQLAMAVGKDVFRFRIQALTLGSCLAGLAGALWAHYISYISPLDFTLLETIAALLIVVLGGRGSNSGVLLAAALLIGFQEVLRFFTLPVYLSQRLAPLQQLIFGALLVLLVLFRPRGLRGR